MNNFRDGVQLSLPWPPTTNHAYATVNSRRVKTKDARMYAALAASLAKAAYPSAPFSTKDRLDVCLILHAPDKRRYDIMNREKILIDSIAPVLGFDDQQIDRFTIFRASPDPVRPRAFLKIEVLNPANEVQAAAKRVRAKPDHKKQTQE